MGPEWPTTIETNEPDKEIPTIAFEDIPASLGLSADSDIEAQFAAYCSALLQEDDDFEGAEAAFTTFLAEQVGKDESSSEVQLLLAFYSAKAWEQSGDNSAAADYLEGEGGVAELAIELDRTDIVVAATKKVTELEEAE